MDHNGALKSLGMVAMRLRNYVPRLTNAPNTNAHKVNNNEDWNAGDGYSAPPCFDLGWAKHLLARRWKAACMDCSQRRAEHEGTNEQRDKKRERDEYSVEDDRQSRKAKDCIAVGIFGETTPHREQPPLPGSGEAKNERGCDRYTQPTLPYGILRGEL